MFAWEELAIIYLLLLLEIFWVHESSKQPVNSIIIHNYLAGGSANIVEFMNEREIGSIWFEEGGLWVREVPSLSEDSSTLIPSTEEITPC